MFKAIRCFIGLHNFEKGFYAYKTGPCKNRKVSKRKKELREFKKCLTCGTFIEVKEQQ